MTKEELKELGLTDEQIAEVFKLNGLAIEKSKGDLSTKETELASTKEQLEEANNLVKELKNSNKDVEELQEKIKQYETKMEELEAEKTEQNKKFQLETALRDAKGKDIDYLIFKLGDLELNKDGS